MSAERLARLLGRATAGARGMLQVDAPLAGLTWFRVGGKADVLFMPADEADLTAFLQKLSPEIPVTVIGLGSNLLIRDGGIAGVVIRLSGRGFGQARREGGNRIRVGAALPDKRLAAFAATQGLGGFAFYHGIPGAIGGALRMNAGANGRETGERLVEARAVDRQGRVHVLSQRDMGFSYRHSEAGADLIFTEAVYEGEPAEAEAIAAEMAEVQAHREGAQPIRERTGGSTFKNPPGESAWRLIDAAGCRGLTLGGAQVSPKHTNFLINTGTATATDLERLGETVRVRVLARSGIRLEWEIIRIGRLPEGVEIPGP